MRKPSDWQPMRLDEMGEIVSGATPSTNISSFWDGDIVWVTPYDLSRLKTPYLFDSAKKITSAGLAGSSTHLLPAKSLVMSSRAPIGYLALPQTEFCTNQGCKSFKLNPDINPVFAYYNLAFNMGKIKNLGEGTTFAEISKTALSTVEMDFPKSYSEQSKIAEVLATVDQAIEQTEALIAKQQRIKTGLMQDLLTRGVDEHGQLRTEQTHDFKDSPLGRIPVEWDVKTFDEVAEISRGKFTHRPRNDPDFYEGDYPFVQTGDVTRNVGRKLTEYSQTLNERGRSVSKEFPAGTIAITIAANIADTAILGIPMCFPDSVVGAVVQAPHDVRFVELRVRRWKPVLEQLAPQSAQRNINLETLKPLLMAMPDGEEQRRIGALYEAVEMAQTDLLAQYSKELALKTALMQDLLTGRKRVTDLLESVAA